MSRAGCDKIKELSEIMITSYERSDIIHIMKMNRFILSDSDTASLSFSGRADGKNHQITILVLEGLPQISVKRNGVEVFNANLKSVDDLKIFLEERLYKYLEA